MVIKFKKLDKEAVAPSRANPTDAGWDLTAMYIEFGEKFEDPITYKTCIAVAIPEGYVGLLFPRSSIYKKDLILANSVPSAGIYIPTETSDQSNVSLAKVADNLNCPAPSGVNE